jgi:monoterpene epsilon-lactone hydrolase
MAYLPRTVVDRASRILLRPTLELAPRHGRRLTGLLRHMSRPPRDVDVLPHEAGGIKGELMVPPGASRMIRLVYFHGGGYRIGSPATQRGLTASLAKAAGVTAFSADYRLAPEHPHPAAVEDAAAVWGALASEGPIALAGDSAGGGLALVTAIGARDAGLPSPVGVGLISPWVDLTLSGESHTANVRAEAVLTPRALRQAVAGYAGRHDPGDPRVSPLFADLAHLPPMLIHTGGNDLLLSECQSLAERVRAARGTAELRVFDRMWHDFHVNVGILREADHALAEMGAWIAARLDDA